MTSTTLDLGKVPETATFAQTSGDETAIKVTTDTLDILNTTRPQMIISQGSMTADDGVTQLSMIG